MSLHEQFHRYFPHVNRELKEFYAAIAIRGFAIFLITIFEPIYIYIHFGHSLPKTFIYFGVGALLFGVLSPFAVRLTKRFGIKHTMLASVPFLFLYYVGLWNIEHLGVFVVFLPVLMAIDKTLFWPAYHIAFTRFSDKGRRGQEVSFRTMLLSGMAAIAPFIGGLIIQKLGGFPVLFAVVLALLFASMVPLFMSKEIYEGYRGSIKGAFREMTAKKYRRKAFAMASLSGDLILEAFVWPIFLFIIAINFETLGIITSAALFLGMIFTFYVGRKTDTAGSEKVLSVGSFLNAAIWPFKIFVNSPLTAFLSEGLHRFGRTSSHIAFGALVYEWAGETKAERDKLIIFRETVLNVSRAFMFFILAIVTLFEFPISYLFAAGPVLALGLLLMIDKPKEFIQKTAEGIEPL